MLRPFSRRALLGGMASVAAWPAEAMTTAQKLASGVLGGGRKVNPGVNANRFFVLAPGNWDFSSTPHWSTVTNGPGGASPPGQTDSPFFDANSGSGAVTVTANQSVNVITLGAFVGTLTTNGKTINAASVVRSGTAVQTLNISGSPINLSGTNGNVWNFASTATNLTLISNSASAINLPGAGACFAGGGKSYGNVTISGGGDAVGGATTRVAGNNTFGNLTFIGTASFVDRYTFGSATQTVTVTFTATGNSLLNRLWVSSSAIGTNRTVNAAAVSLSNVDFSNMIGAGTASPFTGASLGDFGGNSGITFTPPKTVYFVHDGVGKTSGPVWALASGGVGSTANFPLPQDTKIFDANSFPTAGLTFIQDTPRWGSLDFTGATNNPIFNTPLFATYYIGSLTIAPGMTCTGSVQHNWVVQAGVTATYTSNGVKIIGDIQMNCAPTGVLQLGDDANINENLIVNQGTFNTNNHNLTCGTGLYSNSSQTRTVNFGTSTVSLATNNASGGTVADFSTAGLTLSAASATFVLSNTLAITSNRTFNGGGQTFGNLTWADTFGGAGGLVFLGANTFASFTVSPMPVAKKLTLPASTTTTVTALSLAGQSGALLSVVSSTPGTPATISSAATINTDYLSIKDIAFTGGGTWHAGAHSVDAGGNTGILFP